MTKKSIQKIFFVGVHKMDLVMYAAWVLKKLDYQVLIVDRTRGCEFQNCILRPERQLELVSYKDIDFAFSDLVRLEEPYDYIFFVEDFLEKNKDAVQQTVYICDGLREHQELLKQELAWKQQIEKRKGTDVVVLRNLYHSYGHTKWVKESFMEGLSLMECPHDCMDEAQYQHMQYHPFSNIPQISAELEKCLRELLCKAAGIEEKHIRRGIKMAKRG